MTCCRHCTTSLSAGKGGAVLCKAQVVCCLERSYHCEDGHVTVQTDFLSYPATNMDKASIRSRSHGEDVSKLVDQSSEAAISEERRKSETDLAASQGLPPVKSTINTNDLRYVEREVSNHVSVGDTAHLITAPVEVGADSNSCHIHNCVRGKRHQLDWTLMIGSHSLCRSKQVQSQACPPRPYWGMASGTIQQSLRAAGALHG